jgi:hypothetical protein
MHPASTAVPATSGGNVNGWRSLPLVAAPLPQFVVEELPDDFCKARTGFIRHPPGLTVRSAWSKELRPKRRQ